MRNNNTKNQSASRNPSMSGRRATIERSDPACSPVPLVGRLKVRTFIADEDVLMLQTCCDSLRIPMTIGGDPGGITGRIAGFERAPGDSIRNPYDVRVDWMVVYLHPFRPGELYALRAMFRDAARMAPNVKVQAMQRIKPRCIA